MKIDPENVMKEIKLLKQRFRQTKKYPESTEFINFHDNLLNLLKIICNKKDFKNIIKIPQKIKVDTNIPTPYQKENPLIGYIGDIDIKAFFKNINSLLNSLEDEFQLRCELKEKKEESLNKKIQQIAMKIKNIEKIQTKILKHLEIKN